MQILFSNCLEMLNSDHFYLPSEVWSHIFSFLKVRDRKNVRLTCSQWYNACNTLSILEDEKMIICPDLQKRKLWFEVLLDSPRLRFDVEFKLVEITPNSAIFWQKCGSRIESLKFIDLDVHVNFLFASVMMKYCSNLKKLHIDRSELILHRNACFQFWDELLTHESLKSLTLVNCSLLADFHLSRLFDIYPCISKLEFINLRINCHQRVDLRFYKPHTEQFYSPLIFSFSCLFAHIKSKAENIKTLVFDKVGNNGITDNWLEDLASLSGLKLNELKLNDHPLLTEKAFLKFFSNQTHLKYVCIKKCQHFSLKCFLHMIRNCLSLVSIKAEILGVSPNFSISREIFVALISLPILKILKLTGTFFMEENVNCVAQIKAAAFQRLRELSLKMPVIYYDMFLPKISFNLSALHLLTKFGENGLTDANLQQIFDEWIHLRSLKLSLDSSVTDFGFTGCRVNSNEYQTEDSGISINRLKRLQRLVLVCNKYVDNSIIDASFSHFVFPELRKIKLINFSKIPIRSFEILCENTPSVEYCELRKCEIESPNLFKIIHEKWKNLYHFHTNPRN